MQRDVSWKDACTVKIEDHLAASGRPTAVAFAAPEAAKAILSRVDDYILAMHPAERALAMGSAGPVSRDAYLKFLADNVLPWTDDERDRLKKAMRRLDAWLDPRRLNVLDALVFIKTTGLEMYNCAYTRSNAIVLPEGKLSAYAGSLDLARLLAHEYFHVLTRKFPRLRSQLYRLLGFQPLDTGAIEIPETVKKQMLTNPDAPRWDHYAHLWFKGKPTPVIPVTLLKTKTASVDATQDILNSLKTRLMVITQQDGSWAPRWYLGRPRCLDLFQVTGWRMAVVKGENMIFDPEELLADCFVGVLTGKSIGPAAKIGYRMAAIIPNVIYPGDSQNDAKEVRQQQ